MPREPTDEESKCHYNGLSDPPPQLLAFTSNTLAKPGAKMISSPPEFCEIVVAMRDEQLVEDLKEAMQKAEPFCMLPVRLGPKVPWTDLEHDPDEELTNDEHPVILLVSVNPNSDVTHKTALEAALACKYHLWKYQNIPINVEICKTKTGQLPPTSKKTSFSLTE